MKKFTIIFAALFAANMVSAQIYLEKTIMGGLLKCLHADEEYFDCGKIVVTYRDSLVELYNDDWTLYKKVRFASSSISNFNTPINNSVNRLPSVNMSPTYGMYLFTRNIFTTDGKVAFIRWSNNHSAIYNEDGQIVFDLQDGYSFGLFSINGKWKLLVNNRNVYSLPGTGDSNVDVMSPVSPRRSSTRKYLHNDQVLIENADHTYTLTGQEVK